jgi:hypothetical protein
MAPQDHKTTISVILAVPDSTFYISNETFLLRNELGKTKGTDLKYFCSRNFSFRKRLGMISEFFQVAPLVEGQYALKF